jgi:hypothetical protein
MLAPKQLVWGAITVAASLTVHIEVLADDPKPFPPPSGQRIVVLEGESLVFFTGDNNTVKAAAVSNSKVCAIAPFRTSATSAEYKTFALQGLKRGVSQVTFQMENPLPGSTYSVATFPVVVVPDKDARTYELEQLAAFIRTQLNLPETPEPSKLQVVGVPGSRKVVVSGLAPNQWTADKIFEMIIGDKICADEIVNELMVICPPPPPPPPCCRGLFHHHHG